MRSEPGRGIAGGVTTITLTLIAWSAVPLFLKYLTGHIDAWTANGWRYGLSALFWSPVLLFGWSRGTLPRGLWRAAMVPTLINMCGQCCFAWSPYFIGPGLLTFMLRFQIIFIAVGAYVLFPSERRILRTRSYRVGAVIVLAGSIGTCLLGSEVPRGATALGIVLAIAAGILFGGYSLSVRYFMRGVHPVTAFAAISQCTALGLVVIMFGAASHRGVNVLTLSATPFLMLVASALIGIALAHVFYYASIAHLGVAVSAGVILLQPFATGAASYVLFGERLTAAQWVSGGIAIVGAVLMLRIQHKLSISVEPPERPAATVRPKPADALQR
jgi:drug/metabolite transporter (DMT)-like permease